MEARIVKVLSDSKITINKGRYDGVKKGSMYLIYSLDPDDVIDPETGENLGKIEIPKGYARVIHIQDRLTTLEGVAIKPESPLTRGLVRLIPDDGITPAKLDAVSDGDCAREITL